MVYYKRSTFLFSYWDEKNKIVLYNYNKFNKALVSKEVMKIVENLSRWTTVQELSDKLQIDKKSLATALQLLVKMEIIDKKNESNKEPNIHQRKQWDPIDLAMQRQRSYGGSFPVSNRVGKSPYPIKHMKGISSVVLPVSQNTVKNTVDLLSVLEERKSIRRYDSGFITLDKLSDFLYHSARVKKITSSDEGTLTRRPYPSGGARYPLEIYVLNNRISGLQKGIHFYDPLKHQLNLINKNDHYQRKFNSLLRDALSSLMNRDPQVVLIITAVFARTMWKYDKLGLSLILSDLGCLYQTMYLVATQMKLAPCPIGKTQEELVKKWLKLNWFEESHIGTFMLGVPETR